MPRKPFPCRPPLSPVPLKTFEKYLKVRLLNRTTRRVSLTPEGMQYLAQCREILALIEHSESTLSESVARPQGAPAG